MILTVIVPVYNLDSLLMRALKSIPVRKDIEVLIINDASTDRTLEVALEYQKDHPNTRIITNPHNLGLGATKNVGYDNALGDYINQLDADDYLYTEKYNSIINMLDGTDMVYMDLRINNGSVWKVRPETNHLWC